MRNILRAALRRSVRTFEAWLVDSDPYEGERARHTEFAYCDLNCKILDMVREHGKSIRAHFGWGVLQAANLAKSIGYKEMSVIEFGVAGGNGLLSLETVSEWTEKALGVKIEVYGFDTGQGLPEPTDYRDMPNVYTASTYRMDVDRLKQRLRRADLRIGPIGYTLPRFLEDKPPPVGFISVDVDLYSSTVDTLKLFDARESLLLPRIHTYFDDIIGLSCADFLGERLGIAEFNQSHERRKISPIHGLNYLVPRRYATAEWTSKLYMTHILDHSHYCLNDGLMIRKENPLAPAQ